MSYAIVDSLGRAGHSRNVIPTSLEEGERVSLIEYFSRCTLRGPGFDWRWGPAKMPRIEVHVRAEHGNPNPGHYYVNIVATSLQEFRWVRELVLKELGFETRTDLFALAWEVLDEHTSFWDRVKWLFKGVIPSIR